MKIKYMSFEESLKNYIEFLEINNREPTHREMVWVSNQKIAYKAGKLSQERIDKLLSINPNFFDKKDDRKSWDERLEEYVKFLEINNREPTQKETFWVTDQIRVFKKGKLSQERIDKLLSITPNFFDKKYYEKLWDEKLEEYVKFLEINNREPTQKEMVWVDSQKIAYKAGKLSQERIDKLLSVNPNFFDKKYNKKYWDERLEEYVKFLEINNREPTQKEMVWVDNQKIAYKAGKLSQERIDKLLSVNPNFFDKKKSITKWEVSFRKYIHFLTTEFREPQSREMPWAGVQRYLYKKGKLSQERVDKLLSKNPNFFDKKARIKIIRNSNFYEI